MEAAKSFQFLQESLNNNDGKSLVFRDQFGTAYLAAEDIDGKRKVVPVNSQQCKNLIARLHVKHCGRKPSKKQINEDIFMVNAFSDIAPEQELHLRVARTDEIIRYSLGDDFSSIVVVKPDSWSIVRETDIQFRRYPVGGQQVLPTAPRARFNAVDSLFNYVNLVDRYERILFQAYLISCFVPDIAHPASFIFGSEGSAKSTVARLIKAIVDPAKADLLSFPSMETELAQICSHHYVSAFDNLTRISKKQSDMLCRVVTGGTVSKRKLFSDQDDCILSFKGCLVLTGINLVAESPDLLDRSLLFEFPRIPNEIRKLEAVYWQSFEQERPMLLGWIFGVLSSAIRIVRTVRVAEAPRMADFYYWGLAITEALGYPQDDFITAMAQNRAKINRAVLESNSLASTIADFMQSATIWDGRVSDLLQTLIHRYDSRNLPKAANQLSRSIREITGVLEKAGVEVAWGHYSKDNVTRITLRRVH